MGLCLAEKEMNLTFGILKSQSRMLLRTQFHATKRRNGKFQMPTWFHLCRGPYVNGYFAFVLERLYFLCYA